MKKQKAVVYPFSLEFCPIIRHKSLLAKHDIVGVVAPKGFGITGSDSSFADGGESTGLVVSEDFNASIKKCETVIFADAPYYFDFENDIYTKMKEAIRQKKNIVSLMDISDSLKEKLSELCSSSAISYEFLTNIDAKDYLYRDGVETLSKKEFAANSNVYESIYKIQTPVVFIMGVTERTCKFEIQLSIREKLLELGYNVSQVGTRNYCEIMGFHSFPKFMYSKSFSEVEKIIMFNNYIRDIELHENPDVIIIGIPGGIMKVSNEYTNKFGIYAYEISQAVEPDYVIMSTFYESFTNEYFQKISDSTKYRFGYEVDCFNLSNVQLNWTDVIQLKNDVYIKLDNQFISKKISCYEGQVKIFNVFQKNHIDLITDNLIGKLSDYATIEVI